MITRLKVSGFKNLVNVDIRFGLFTCIAGANGVGKSNLFDAIRFLSLLADYQLIEAALLVRDKSRNGEIRSLFHRVGNQSYPEMSFEVEMIIPSEGVDDLGQKAEASITFLRYSLKLAYLDTLDKLEITKEELVPIILNETDKHILFDYQLAWFESAIKGHYNQKIISTEIDPNQNKIIKLYQDNSTGQTLSRLAQKLPRTILSVINGAEYPTALLVRREMQSWQLLQLEPSSLRKPDEFTASTKLGTDGSHLAATLYNLANLNKNQDHQITEIQIYAQVASRLRELLDEVDSVWVDRDDRRELLTLMVKNIDGTIHPARSLSDGTMRFLALVVLELDPNTEGLICLEEPENGIHPEQIPNILRLLEDITTDTTEPIGFDNPLRQVIINTHSPAVVQQVSEDSLLLAELKQSIRNNQRFLSVYFSYLENTWRCSSKDESQQLISKGKILAYLNPTIIDTINDPDISNSHLNNKKRVVDRSDIKTLIIPGFPPELL